MESELRTFDEIYVLDLHGNSMKKEKCLDGSKDENVFVIQQVTAIILMLKVDAASCRIIKREEGVSTFGNPDLATPKVLHHELSGLRQIKYDWLDNNQFQAKTDQEQSPSSPFYLLHPEATGNEHYLQWISLPEIFPVNSVGILTARDSFAQKPSP